jgi:4-amino-4-deoxy-L-arabinose transferase-like glycosyltransferase
LASFYRREWLVVASLGALALLLRLAGLGQVPPGVRFDELVNVKMADHIYAGEWPIYFQEAWGHEPLYHYLHAGGMWLLGKTVLGVRVASVLLGTAGVLTTYLAMRTLFGRGIAAVAALLLATSFWSLMYSRIGLRHISLPPWIGLATYCTWRGLEAPPDDRRQVGLWSVLAGVSLGAMLYTYFASRVVPLIFSAFLLYLLAFHRGMLRGRGWALVVAALLAVVIVTPMVLYLRAHPELEQRLAQVSGGLLGALCAGDAPAALEVVTRTLGMFSFRGDPEWLYNISGRPILDPLTSLAFYVGLGTVLWRWRDPGRAFLLLWLLFGLAPSLLSWPPGSLGHTIVAQPATFGLAALGMGELWAWSGQRRRRWLRIGARSLVVTMPLLFAGLNLYDYAVRWPRHPEVQHEYQASITAVARHIARHPEVKPAAVSAPYVDYWNPWSKMNFDLYAGEAGAEVRLFDGGQALVLPMAPGSYTYLPDHILLPSELAPPFAALLARGAVPVAPHNDQRLGKALTLYHWLDTRAFDERIDTVAAAPAWASPETAYVPGASEAQRISLSMPLHFERLALLGYSYDREVTPGAAWQVTTYWRVLQADAAPLAIFVHLLDSDHAVRAGWDGFYVATAGLQEGDRIAHLHTLALPTDLAAGTWRVEVGIYSPQTLERFPLWIERGAALSEQAPYDRALLRSLTVE